MTETILAENSLLKEHRQALLDAFNKTVKEIQGLPRLENHDKMDVLGVLARNMQEVTDQYPIIKDFM
jgi:truncated hemoglobin YjbI